MLGAILAAAFTFTATATGVAKGTPLEFLFAAKDSDRDYETMFTLDMDVAAFAKALDKAGMPAGRPTDPHKCRVWPAGTPVSLSPDPYEFVSVDTNGGFRASRFVYTGGTRDEKGVPVAATVMPESVFSFYSLSQSLAVPDGIHEQGDVYGKFTAAQTLKKGERYAFTLSWDPEAGPKRIRTTIKPGGIADFLRTLRAEAAKRDLDVEATFDGEMTIEEAIAAARAIEMLDSVRIKFNGCADGTLFYRAFLPLVQWTERQNRLVQPFELTVTPDGAATLVFIEEDWSVEGIDPKLTPREIGFSEARSKDKTDTCFIYAEPKTKLKTLYEAMGRLAGSKVRTWYVLPPPPRSLHNPS